MWIDPKSASNNNNNNNSGGTGGGGSNNNNNNNVSPDTGEKIIWVTPREYRLMLANGYPGDIRKITEAQKLYQYLGLDINDVKIDIPESYYEEYMKTVTTLDDNGMNYIANLERNLYLIEYDKNTKVITKIPISGNDVGYGHDFVTNPGPPVKDMTAAEALQLLESDVEEVTKKILGDFSVNFTKQQLAAVVAMKYNFGHIGEVDGLFEALDRGNWKRKELEKIIGDYYRAIVKYDSSQEGNLAGWLNRMESMLNLFFNNDYGYMPIDAINGRVK